jgi:hypothetical protein
MTRPVAAGPGLRCDVVSGENRRLVDEGDLDELIRHVDRLCATGGWDDLEDLRHRARAAHERGRQLWPVASLAEYRLALRAPAPWAAAVLTEGTGAWALGPLPEVAASTHSFASLAPHLSPGPAASATAHEAVARGEDLTGEASISDGDPDGRPGGRDLSELVAALVNDEGLPLRLCDWEPRYPVATYRDDRIEFEGPDLPPSSAYIPLGPGSHPTTDGPDPGLMLLPGDAATASLRDLVAGWMPDATSSASAHLTAPGIAAVRVAAVRGGAADAVRAVAPRCTRWAPLDPADALACMAWASASGGETGRRRGLARGRFDAWWTLACLGGSEDDWPLDPEDAGALAADLAWWTFEDPEAPAGWHLRLAVADPDDGLAWAVNA